jgi:orotate phosphoribosyltransferase
MNLGFNLYEATTRQVARALITSGAYKIKAGVSEEEFFTWSSGIRAPVYNNCRELDRQPGAKGIVVCAFESSIRANFPSANWIVGVGEGGITWSAAVAYQLGLPHSVIRKYEKNYGDGSDRFVISAPPSKTTVNAVVIDDLLASGKTLTEKIERFEQETGIKPIGVQTIVNWNFTSFRKRFEKLEIETCALVSYPQILETAVEENLLTWEAAIELTKFYQNPKEHQWNLKALRETSKLKRVV